MTPRPKPAQNIEAATVQSPQLLLPFEPVPDDAVQRLLRTLYDLAIGGNTAAAKLFVDLMKDKTSDPAALTVEDALKMIQERLRNE